MINRLSEEGLYDPLELKRTFNKTQRDLKLVGLKSTAGYCRRILGEKRKKKKKKARFCVQEL